MWNGFMHDGFWGPAVSGLGFGAIALSIVFILIALWSLAWKALALWNAAKHRQRVWFIVILLINTVGILEIVYLAWFAKDADGNSPDLFPFLKGVREKISSGASSDETKVVPDAKEEKELE